MGEGRDATDNLKYEMFDSIGIIHPIGSLSSYVFFHFYSPLACVGPDYLTLINQRQFDFTCAVLLDNHQNAFTIMLLRPINSTLRSPKTSLGVISALPREIKDAPAYLQIAIGPEM